MNCSHSTCTPGGGGASHDSTCAGTSNAPPPCEHNPLVELQKFELAMSKSTFIIAPVSPWPASLLAGMESLKIVVWWLRM